MPNFSKAQAEPEEKPQLVPVEDVDNYKAQRANVAALLEVYRNTGIADAQLIAMGIVHG